jgi:hypothetical protein
MTECFPCYRELERGTRHSGMGGSAEPLASWCTVIPLKFDMTRISLSMFINCLHNALQKEHSKLLLSARLLFSRQKRGWLSKPLMSCLAIFRGPDRVVSWRGVAQAWKSCSKNRVSLVGQLQSLEGLELSHQFLYLVDFISFLLFSFYLFSSQSFFHLLRHLSACSLRDCCSSSPQFFTARNLQHRNDRQDGRR